ncbi:TraB/GumN family protein [Zobellella taiwanensis]|uniref:TraB/GumN family protein n=1 Tax=Zobellella taiwanensis TaxID=347535 RepID=A0A2P7R350_9GAMM|nr:TraB/GumN family protein [Zobellella taiwanensis]PSJ44639.1 TraB/GumN family protein [Zobellella taiwanensis]
MKILLHTLLWLWCTQALAAPALWSATRGEQQLWLFGSIHLADERLARLPPLLLQALEQSELLLLEVDPLAITPDSLGSVIEPDTDWQARLGAPLAQELATTVATSGQPGLRRLPPWFAALQLTQLKAAELGFHSHQGVDMQLRMLARQQSLPVAGLESPTLVLGLLGSMHQRQLEADFVRHSLDEMTQMADHLERLMETWLSGDEQALLTLLREQPGPRLGRFIEQELLHSRNRLWLERLEQLAPKRALMVVGALHLYGEQGIIALLADAGYTLSKTEDITLY